MRKMIAFAGMIVLFVLLIAVVPFVNDARPGMTEKLIPYYDYETMLYGYCTLDGEVRISPRFDFADEFAECGLACAREEENFGYINTSGEYVIDGAEYIRAERFQDNGLVTVLKGKAYGFLYGLMNERGELVTEIEYDYIWPFAENGLAVVEKDGKYGYINERGEIGIGFEFDYVDSFASNGLAVAEKDGKCGYINKRGEFVIEPRFDDALHFCEDGLARVVVGKGADRKFGFIDESGEYVIETEFNDVSDFSECGLASFCIGEGYHEDFDFFERTKYGYISRDGEVVIEPQYKWAYDFSGSGLAAVSLDVYDSYTYITTDGSPAFDEKFYFVKSDSFANCGLAAVEVMTDEGAKWGYIDESGKFVIEPRFDDVENFREDGLAKVSFYKYKDDELVEWSRIPTVDFYINTNGEIIAPENIRNTEHTRIPMEF